MRTRLISRRGAMPLPPVGAILVIAAGLVPAVVPAQTTDTASSARPSGAPEQVVVVGERVYPIVDSLEPSRGAAVDTAELLRRLPGANLNANGMLTGIAQYRGLYGDRVAVTVDGAGALTGGPNSMDAPLSYASPLLLSHLSLERGIASVSSATETLGGHIDASQDRGDYGTGNGFTFAGRAQTRVATNGNLNTTAVQLVGANDTHKVALLGEHDRADDFAFPGGDIVPTRLDRDRFDLSYAFDGGDTEALVYAGKLETHDTGTPSLPMDIRLIDTNMLGAKLTTRLGGKSMLDIVVADSDVEHVMDNYGVRPAPASPMSYRSTYAAGSGTRFRIGSTTELARGSVRIGLDGETATHDATITNPNVAPFRIENFNAASRDLAGLYAQWNRAIGAIDVEAGVRYNRVDAGSGTVAASIPAMNPMMQMMATAASTLADAFNSGRRNRTYDNVDVVVKVGRPLGEMRNIYLEVARKTRAPSYQELFLWLPLEATGGLADGRSYIGNTDLRAEVSGEINLGSNWQSQRAWVAPQIFYKDIADYIQGTPTANAVANMVAMMMTGKPALEFANTDAKIWGVDLAWGYYLSDRLTVSGVLTGTRGRRTDVTDNLYRLAPLNGQVALSYAAEDWLVRVEAIGYAAQNRVSAYNAEPRTAGYGLLNAGVEWRPREHFELSATAANLLDRDYRDHLDGINRAMNADIAIGERLPGLGRSIEIGFRYDW